MNDKNNKIKWLHLRLDEKEFSDLNQSFSLTTERYLSRYARKILLGKPMIKSVRNTGLEEIIALLKKLQKDFNGIGNNYNQMVHRLHVLSDNSELQNWIQEVEKSIERIREVSNKVNNALDQSVQKWLQ
jgi:methyl-accepting chemotaxis protein